MSLTSGSCSVPYTLSRDAETSRRRMKTQRRVADENVISDAFVMRSPLVACATTIIAHRLNEPWSSRPLSVPQSPPSSPLDANSPALSAWSWSDTRMVASWSDSVQLFILDAVKLAVIQRQFWMKECDILRGWKHTLTLPTYFQGVRTSPLQDLRPWWATRAIDDQSWGDSVWAVIYEDCRRQVTRTHVLEFCLGPW